MYDTRPPIRFFMGSNTPDGFFGFTEDIYRAADGWRAWLIKGGPGTGKSTLMRRIGRRWEQEGKSPEYLHCSSDPTSLDGVICRADRLCVLDATAPHVIEPRYWSAVESILPLDRCVSAAQLAANREEVVRITDACKAEHRRCCRYLGAAASLLEDGRRLAQTGVNAEKVRRSADRLAARELGRGSGGREWRRFLDAITPDGYKQLTETLGALCPRIVSLEDDTGAVAPLFLETVRERAQAAGYEMFSCYCPLAPTRLMHLLIPEAGLALTTSNARHKADYPVYRRIHAARFLDAETVKAHRPRQSFHRRAVRELLAEATAASAAAKQLHDALEALYLPAVDWTAVDALVRETGLPFA